MKSSKSEYIYLFLSVLVLIALVGLYLVFGRNYGSYQAYSSVPSQMSAPKEDIVTEKEVSSEEKQIAELTAALADLEKAPTNESLLALQERVENLADQTKKAELQTRLEAVATELTNQSAAETAVADAEGYQVLYNVDVAQAAINQLTNESKRSELQARLDVVANAIQASYVETTPVIESDFEQ